MINQSEFELIKFKFEKDKFLNLWVSKNSDEFFVPNEVTKFLVSQITIEKGDVVFEIGSGIGPISLILAQKFPFIDHIYCVDIVPEQIALAKKNIDYYNYKKKITAFVGNLFEPICENFPSVKANVIIDDCSALSPIAHEMGWYPENGKIPGGGNDGTNMVIPFLNKAGNHLAKNGKVYFPTTPNFSNESKIIQEAKLHFSSLTLIAEKKIPLTSKQIQTINNTDKSFIFEDIERVGTRGFWTAKIWQAKK